MATTPRTLERDGELARIAAVLDGAADGAGRFLVIEGPPGIGKTRLMEHARQLAKERGFGRITATGDAAERALPWGIIRQLVERSVLRYSGETRQAILAGPPGAALRAIDHGTIDRGGTASGGTASGESAGDEAVLMRTLHALWWVAADLAADRPLLITIDDLQWADEPSLRYVGYLARRLADLPIALIVATRPPGMGDGLLAELTAARTGERLLPAPLSVAALGELAEATGQPATGEVLTALHAASGGNPFLAGQLLAELDVLGRSPGDPGTAATVAGLGPRSVSRALLARLSPAALALASAAAVLGQRCDARQAARVAQGAVGLEAADVHRAVEELTRMYVLVDHGRELTFAHPVIRESVLRELSSADRAAMHATAATDLYAAGAAATRVAVHLAEATPGTLDGTAGRILAEAGRALLAEGVAGTAASYLERALEYHGADDGLRADLGMALLADGRLAAARDRLLAAAGAAEAAGSPRLAAERIAAAATATLRLDGPRAAVRALHAALDTFDPGDDPAAALALEVRLGMASAYLPEEFERSGRRLRRFAGLPGATDDERTLLALVVQRGFAEVRPAAEILGLAPRALDADAARRKAYDGLITWGSAMHAVILADGVELASRELDRARARLLPGGSPMDFVAISVVAAVLAWRVGEVARCEADALAAAEALALAEPGPFAAAMGAVAARYGALAAIERDDLPAARAALHTYDSRVGDAPPTVPVNRVLLARAAIALAADDPALACREALALGAAERAAGSNNPAIPWRVVAALAAQRLGNDGTARDLADEQHELAQRWGAASDVGAVLRLLARVGDQNGRLDRLREAVDVLSTAPARLEYARAVCDLGETLRVAGRRADAREPLRTAARLAAECEAPVLRKRALDALARLGDRPREPTFSGVDALTASERRVAQLAVSGRSNREIAQEIFVTPKTVENHLGRVYQKLGIRSRRELTAALT